VRGFEPPTFCTPCKFFHVLSLHKPSCLVFQSSGKIQANGKYKKGYSGNPNGKPKGARNKSTLAAEALLEGSFDKICKKVEFERQYAGSQDNLGKILAS
jgi:hypothetical protein